MLLIKTGLVWSVQYGNNYNEENIEDMSIMKGFDKAVNGSRVQKIVLSALLWTAGITGMAGVVGVADTAHAQVSAPNETGVSFGHVHLNVSDVEAQAELWSDMFDGVTVRREGFTAVEIPGILVFLRERESSGPTAETVMDHLGLTVRNLDEILDRWESLGYENDSAIGNMNRVRRAFITMPGGTKVELIETPDQDLSVEMDHIHLIVPETESLAGWYAELFGAEPLSEGMVGLTAPIPGTNMMLSESTEDRLGTAGSVVDHIGFEVEDLNAFADRVRSLGIEFDSEPRYLESIDLWLAFLTDPSGVYIELTEGLNDF